MADKELHGAKGPEDPNKDKVVEEYPNELIPDSLKHLNKDQIKHLVELQEKFETGGLDNPALHLKPESLKIMYATMAYDQSNSAVLKETTKEFIVDYKLPSVKNVETKETNDAVEQIEKVFTCIEKTDLNGLVFRMKSHLNRTSQPSDAPFSGDLTRVCNILETVMGLFQNEIGIKRMLSNTKTIVKEAVDLRDSIKKDLPTVLLDLNSNPLLLGNLRTNAEATLARNALKEALVQYTKPIAPPRKRPPLAAGGDTGADAGGAGKRQKPNRDNAETVAALFSSQSAKKPPPAMELEDFDHGPLDSDPDAEAEKA